MHRQMTVLLVAVVLVLAACGSDSEESPAPDDDGRGTVTTLSQTPEELAEDVMEDAEEQVESGAADDLLANAGTGTFTVDGQSFDTPVFRCEPFAAFDEPNPDDLNVRALVGDVFVEVDLANSEGIDIVNGGVFDQQSVGVFLSRSGEEGVEQFEARMSNDAEGNWYDGEDFEQATPLGTPFTLDGNTITGSMTVLQNWPEGDTGTADVTFDFMFPPEIQDCSL